MSTKLVRNLVHCLTGFALMACFLATAGTAHAQFSLTFDDGDFAIGTDFNIVDGFDFQIDVAAPLLAGMTYNNPALDGVVYEVAGRLPEGSPSGFPGFILQRTIGGNEFYSQGSSLSFEIAADADLTDGLQIFDLVADPTTNIAFELNAREVGTGRYHPPLLQLRSDGTGLLQNSNNFGGDNPQDNTDEEIDVDFGEEYIADLTFDVSSFTLADPVGVPEPSSLVLGLIGGTMLGLRRRRA